jgi:hypothetical protein
MKKYNNTKIVFTIALLLCAFVSVAQNRISSPYSRYGLGDVQNRSALSVYSMGNINKAILDPQTINIGNPASYSAFDSMSFVFDAAMISSSSNLISSSASQNSNYTSLSYFLIGFPLLKSVKASFGILPFSDIGYLMEDKQMVENIGSVKYIYEGDGGLTQINMGLSYNILPQWSIGANAAYVFGNVFRTRKIEFDSTLTFNTLNKESNNMKGYVFQFGSIYNIKMKNNQYFNIGATYSLDSKLSSRNTVLSGVYSLNNLDEVIMGDTTELILNEKAHITVPFKAGGGVAYGKTNKFMLGLDFEFQNWSSFTQFGQSDSLKNSMKIALGGMYIPNYNSPSFFNRAKYRAGFKYHQSHLDLKNTQLRDISLNVGMGLPLRRSLNNVNIGIEVGQLGTTTNNLIRINYVNIQIGVQFYERWFHRRKLD